jgi:hypothetical protein
MKKHFTKVIMLTAAAMLLAFGSYAQSGRFSVGAEVGLPMGDFGDASGIGIGGTIGYEYPLTDNIALYARAGYITFSGKDQESFGVTVEGASTGMIPVQVGIKYYLNEVMEGFYIDAEVGVHNMRVKTPEFEILGVTYGGDTESETKLSYAPSIGYHLANIDISIRYQIVSTEGSTTSYIGARLAYVFGEN